MTIDEALEADRRRLDACLAADIPVLEELMAEDCLYIHTAGNIDSKYEFVEKVKTGMLRYMRIGNNIERSGACGETVAIAGILEMDLYRGDVPASIRIRYCCTWVSTASGPRMLTWQSTPLANHK